MIKVIALLLVCIGPALAAAFGVFMLQDNMGEKAVAETVIRPVNASESMKPDADQVMPDGALTTSSTESMTEQEREVLIEEVRAQIDVLMDEYETHLKDREKREELKQKIDFLVTKYNELILPVALTGVQRKGTWND